MLKNELQMIEEFKDYTKKIKLLEQELEKSFKKVIDFMVISTKTEREECEYYLEHESKLITPMLEMIPESSGIVEELKKHKKECADIYDKIDEIRMHFIMSTRQITGIDFDRCRRYFEYDEEISIKIFEYIIKIENKNKKFIENEFLKQNNKKEDE